ncbi:hypothetical protein [Afipia felis]|nr:hypothetical protein [Afipia felis]
MASDKPKYKVGQRVRVVREGHNGSGHDACVGDVGTVFAADPNATYCEGIINGPWYFHDSEIEPVFSPGDRVRVTRCNAYFAKGDEGVVERDGKHSVYVKRGDYQRSGLPISAESLEWLGAADSAERNEQQEPKFKAGDVVRLKRFPGVSRTIAGVKTEYSQGVSFDGGTAYDYADTIGWDYEESIELVHPVSQPCIVALVKHGKPRPSQWPHVHHSAAEATKEAERLASVNPGKQFDVYQRVTGRVGDVQVREVA